MELEQTQMRNEAPILLLQQKVNFGDNVGVVAEKTNQKGRGDGDCSLVKVEEGCVSCYTHLLNFMLICIL